MLVPTTYNLLSLRVWDILGMIISVLLPSPTTLLRVWKGIAPSRAKTLWLLQSYLNDKVMIKPSSEKNRGI